MTSTTDSVCGGLETVKEEAIEFAIRNDTSSNGHWIPLRLSYYDSSSVNKVTNTETVRGYKILSSKWPQPKFFETATICGDVLLSNEVQFRWMGSANVDVFNYFRSDMWALATVSVTWFTDDETIPFVKENFGSNKLK